MPVFCLNTPAIKVVETVVERTLNCSPVGTGDIPYHSLGLPIFTWLGCFQLNHGEGMKFKGIQILK